MAYRIVLDSTAKAGIRALPSEVGPVLAEVMTMIGLVPWNGQPVNPRNPKGAVRMLFFAGKGVMTYLILEDQQRVDVLTVHWAG